jgi:hypothetical protein
MIEYKPLTPYLTYDPEDLNKICARVREYDDTADTEHFYTYMRMGMLNHRILPFVAYDKGEMIACTVLSISQSPMHKEEVLYIQWLWVDPQYSTFWKKGIELLYELCNQFKIKKMVGNTKRLPKAMERKFGFKQVDAIIEKEVI